jgi:hypothetical protein
LDLIRDTEEVLDMMAHLMGDYVSLGKIPGSPESFFKIIIKAKIDIDLLIRRAIKRAHGGLPHTASRWGRTTEKDQLWVLVTKSMTLKEITESDFRILEDHRYKLGLLIFRWGPWSFPSHLTGRRSRGFKNSQNQAGIDSKIGPCEND